MLTLDSIKRMMKSGEIVEIILIVQIDKLDTPFNRLTTLSKITKECNWKITVTKENDVNAKILLQPEKIG